MSKETCIPCLLGLFRQHGYDGATLSRISEATGLGKASLYHHFPGGKDEMVETVLTYLKDRLDQHIRRLRGPEEPLVKMRFVMEYLQDIYDEGQQPCVMAILLMGSARGVFHEPVKALFRTWIEAIAAVLSESGLDKQLAHQRAENTLMTIQGALILSQGLDDPSLFQRAVNQLPTMLCQPEGEAILSTSVTE